MSMLTNTHMWEPTGHTEIKTDKQVFVFGAALFKCLADGALNGSVDDVCRKAEVGADKKRRYHVKWKRGHGSEYIKKRSRNGVYDRFGYKHANDSGGEY